MGFRMRRSFKIAPGVRVNVGKKSSSISFGNKYGHTTISTSGRRRSSGHVVEDVTRMLREQGNVSEKKQASNRKFMKVCSVIMTILGIISVFLAIVAFCTAGAAGIFFVIMALFTFFFAWLFNPTTKQTRK